MIRSASPVSSSPSDNDEVNGDGFGFGRFGFADGSDSARLGFAGLAYGRLDSDMIIARLGGTEYSRGTYFQCAVHVLDMIIIWSP